MCILDHIAALEAERRQLWEKAGRGECLNARERDRLATIRATLSRAWVLRRGELAQQPLDAMVEVVRSTDRFWATEERRAHRAAARRT